MLTDSLQELQVGKLGPCNLEVSAVAEGNLYPNCPLNPLASITSGVRSATSCRDASAARPASG